MDSKLDAAADVFTRQVVADKLEADLRPADGQQVSEVISIPLKASRMVVVFDCPDLATRPDMEPQFAYDLYLRLTEKREWEHFGGSIAKAGAASIRTKEKSRTAHVDFPLPFREITEEMKAEGLEPRTADMQGILVVTPLRDCRTSQKIWFD